MKTLEFEAEVLEHELLKLPDEIAQQLVAGDKVRLLLLGDDEEEWRTLAAARFINGYDEADAIYDEL